MLKFLRNKKVQKRVYVGLAIAILPAFLFWGVFVSSKDSNPSASLGLIDKQKITLQQYLASYKAVQHELALRYGRSAKDLSSLVNLKGEAWDRLLLLHYAKKEKLRVSDAEVVEWLASQPIFFHRGEFNTNFYKLYVQDYLHISTREFEEEIRDFLTIDKIREKLASSVSFKEDKIKLLFEKHRRKGKFEDFKRRLIAVKTAKKMKVLLNELRNKLEINLEMTKKIFEDEEKPPLD